MQLATNDYTLVVTRIVMWKQEFCTGILPLPDRDNCMKFVGPASCLGRGLQSPKASNLYALTQYSTFDVSLSVCQCYFQFCLTSRFLQNYSRFLKGEHLGLQEHVFLVWMPLVLPNQKCQSTEGVFYFIPLSFS